MELSARPVKNPSAVCLENPDHWAMLVNLDTAGSLALNPTGVMIWKLVDGRRTAQAIVEGARQSFQEVPENVTQDVLELLDILAGDGLIGFELALAEL